MRTDLGIKKLSELTPVIGSIAKKIKNNEQVKDILEKSEKENSGDIEVFFDILPVLFDVCENDLYIMLSIISEKAIDDIKAQEWSDTIEQIYSLANDMGFTRFFKFVFEKIQEKSYFILTTSGEK